MLTCQDGKGGQSRASKKLWQSRASKMLYSLRGEYNVMVRIAQPIRLLETLCSELSQIILTTVIDGGVMVSALVPGSSSPGSSPGQGTLCSVLRQDT